ncbi:MAG: hypothetical protein R3F16_11815 [Myxococcota bacterium]
MWQSLQEVWIGTWLVEGRVSAREEPAPWQTLQFMGVPSNVPSTWQSSQFVVW